MRIYDNGIYRDMTEEELAQMQEPISDTPTPTEEAAIKTFFEGLADGETNSIAKIRALAQEFLNNTK